MNNFYDGAGRIHDKPTDGVQPSSNNGWLYSAVAKRLGLPIKITYWVGNECAENLSRHPDTWFPPISRDEILGLAYLGFLKRQHLNGWNFSPFVLPKFNLIDFLKQSWEAYGQHRNYFWKKDLMQVGHIAYMVPIQDRHFLLSCWGQYNIIYHIVHIVYSLFPKRNKSSRQIHFLKTGKDIEAVIEYYNYPDHPNAIKARELCIKK